MRLLAPDLGLLFSSLFVLRLCKKLLHPVPQVSLHENGIQPPEAEVNVSTLLWFQPCIPLSIHVYINLIVILACQEAETSETESEEESDTEGSSFDISEETTMPDQSGPPQFVQKLIMFAAGVRLLLSAIMDTAGKVVVTLLLGLAGTTAVDVNIHC